MDTEQEKQQGGFHDSTSVRAWRKRLRNGMTFLLVPDVTVEQCSLSVMVKLKELAN